ncbi:glutamate receptor ionotropic, kainate 2-like [Condylostylus longicornis]|uniref:glutamate receptor ionotropic, kainate 2-like n=1 Tax=Condylostylus longicornis TaxID=2530218 RepID=UPI00244E3656|nr:glutamate receptor ionotropic, kainate 2-like [Condylostylus longicornis]
MSKFWLVVLIPILLLIQICSTSPKIIKIGVIFFPGEDDLELAFNTSVSNSNRKFYNMKIVPIIRYIPADDSIILEKLTCDLISSGTMAIFGPSSEASSDIVEAICNMAGIPHLKYDWGHETSLAEKSFHKMTVNVFPSMQTISKAYADIMTNYGWKQFTIVYEDDITLLKLQDVLQLNAIHRGGIRTYKFDRSEPFGTIWKKSFYDQDTKIVLDCSPDIIKKVLESAIEFNMTEQFKSFLLTDLDTFTVDLREFVTKIRGNITALQLSMNENIDSVPEGRLKTVIIYDAVQLFANALQYIVRYQNLQFYEPRFRCDMTRVTPWDMGPQIVSIMKRAENVEDDELTFISKGMEFDEFGERNNFFIDIYRPMRHITLAVWEPSEGKIGKLEALKSKKAFAEDVQDASETKPHYRVASRIGEPYLMERKSLIEGEILQGNARYEGYALDLIYKLSQQLDFDFTIEVVPDNKYGNLDPNTKEWNGIIRALIDRKADIGICDLTITHERRQAVDFTVPFMQLGISILYYKEPPPDPDLFSFLKPFALEVWVYMATAYLIISILLFLLARIAADEYENPHPCNPNPEELENKWSLTNTTWLTMGSIMGQGCDILPKTGPMRIMNGLWYFFALMMLNSYTANLAAFLTSSRQQSSIGSINDLAQQNKIHFGTVEGGSTSNFFKESNDSIYRLAWSKMIQAKPTVFTKSNVEGLDRIKKSKGLYAFLMETTSLEFITERNCDVTQIGEQIGEKHYGIAVPLGAEYRSNLSVAILKLSEKGEMFALKKKWWKGHNVTCEKFDAGGNNELTLANVGGVFLVLSGGLFTSYIIGIFEFLMHVHKVAVENKMTPVDAFKQEFSFAIKFWVQRKPVMNSESLSGSNSSVESDETTATSKALAETSKSKKSLSKSTAS